jgi:hypothetical protein
MRRHHVFSIIAALAVAGWLGASPAFAGQRRSSGHSGGGQSGGGQSAGRAAPSGGSGGRTTSAPREGSRTPDSSGSGGSTSSSSSPPAATRRPPETTVVGRAAPRNGSTAIGTRVVVIPEGFYGGFYPWGWAGLGFGGYYSGYYGYYDPWMYSGSYSAPYYSSNGDGGIRLKIKPRDASVYVDGGLAGVVDDFDGVFQRLHLPAGPHHLEVTADGYAPLEFDIQIQRDHTITYEAELRRTQ